MEYTFHLGFVAYQTTETDITTEEAQNTRLVSSSNPPPHPPTVSAEVPKIYTKLLRLIEFDTFVATHGPGTDVDGNY